MDQSTSNLIWWVFALPIFGFLVQSLTGKMFIDSLGPKIGKVLMGTLAVLPIAIAFLISVGITKSLGALGEHDRTVIVTLFDWIQVGGLHIPFEFRIDTLSMTMVLIITGIGSLIHIFATAYMFEDKDYARFFTYLNLFVAAMLCLVLGNNLLLLFIGWEGVGVCSYLLIGFWYTDVKNSLAANKAFITNRVGDWGLTLGIFLLVAAFLGTPAAAGATRLLSYDVLIPALVEFGPSQVDPTLMFWAVICLFIGAMGKSAQFPLYVWLPDAMAGPTPVSALIHAATMVTSGVFLLNRMSPVVQLSPMAMSFIAIVGVVTAALGALIAFGQSDIKKVLAFSTVSQLGYMFIACGVGAYWVGLFHVITHAFFKALLFLGSGAVIYAMSHNQEMPNYGKLRKYLPVTSAVMLAGWLAIAGFPFFAGFFSKEEILHAAELAKLPWEWVGPFAFYGALVVAVLTAAYMTRMTMMTFFSGEERWRLLPAHDHHGHNDHHEEHTDHDHAHHDEDENGYFMSDAEYQYSLSRETQEEHHDLEPSHEPKEVSPIMWLPLTVLAFFSIFGGAWLLKGVKLEEWLSSSVFVAHHGDGHTNAHAFNLGTELQHYFENPLFWMSIAAFVIGVGYGVAVYGRKLPAKDGMDTNKWSPLRKLAGKQFFFDTIATDGSIKAGSIIGLFCKNIVDRLIDGIVNGIPALIGAIAGQLKSLQSGFVRGYAAVMQIGIVAVIAYVLYLLVVQGGSN